ncbi:MAG TPA: glycoside hydrolase family 2 TIM barrel-domain containing protein [Puia sp.]|nr:glycoside hydrolase family 2 TIM barrel-domain containing protein [Puia sp.]
MKKIITAWFLGLSALFFIKVSAQELNDWENPQKVSLNTISPHAFFIPYPDEKSALKKDSSAFIQALDGIWKFHLSKNPAQRPIDFYNNSFDVSKWNDIKVPSNWQAEGYDKFIFTDVEYPIPPNPPYTPKDDNPVGSYKKEFTISDAWKGKNIFIHFGAVNSFFYLWINQHYVGFSKDSKTPAEFDITKFLQKGENTVSVQVFRFSDGTYLEGQDMWKISGIERSVYLLARPQISIYDFFADATLDSNYQNGLFDIRIALNKPQPEKKNEYIEVKLMDDKKEIIYSSEQSMNETGKQFFHFSAIIKNAKQWNAEHPYLYTLIINHRRKKTKEVENISQEIGFRKIEVKHGLLLVNGVAIKIKGVNRHEHDMYNAKVITKESMENDIRIMKEYNMNAMRCSHYPNREEWYELCNRYGLYVIDEVNLECDGMSLTPIYTLSDKPEWKAAYLDRTQRMFERDKNFSCIIIWSLGNESRWGGNLVATHDYLKSKDSSRPVQYEEARDNPYTDIIAPMYKPLDVMQNYVKEWHDRPLIQVEYAHMMGNSGGNFKDDWEMIYKYPQLQGGFIWDFCDQTFKKKDKYGRWIWAYGRDMGSVGNTSDTSFCADGLFHADRTPHPQAFEVKKIYQNISFEALPLQQNSFQIINHFDFTNLNQYDFDWYIKANGKFVQKGKLADMDVIPNGSKNISIGLPVINIQPNTEYFLTIEAKTKYATNILPAGYIIAWEQFELPWHTVAQPSAKENMASIQTRENQEKINISNASFSISFNKKTGWLESYIIQNKELVKSPLVPYFWRAATDNDIGNSLQLRSAIWQHATDNIRLENFNVSKRNDSITEIQTEHYLPVVDAKYCIQYQIDASGMVHVHSRMEAGKKDLPELPRFGMCILIQPDYEDITWLGRGPFDNYWDRNAAAAIDVYRMKADSLFFPYARAQESGYRTDVRWVALQNKNHNGIMAIGSPLISTGIVHFDMHKLDFNRDSTGNNHGGSIMNDDFIWWNIDYRQMGVGGDNSWGAKTHSEYTLPYRDYEYSFILKPFSGNLPDQFNQPGETREAIQSKN